MQVNISKPEKKKGKFIVDFHHKLEIDLDDWLKTYGREAPELAEAFRQQPSEANLVALITHLASSSPEDTNWPGPFDAYWYTVGCRINTLVETCDITYPEGYTGIRGEHNA